MAERGSTRVWRRRFSTSFGSEQHDGHSFKGVSLVVALPIQQISLRVSFSPFSLLLQSLVEWSGYVQGFNGGDFCTLVPTVRLLFYYFFFSSMD